MSFSSFNRTGPALEAPAISNLQVVFDKVCGEIGEQKSSNAAHQTAAVLIRSYQRGIEDHDMLIDIGRAVIRSAVERI